MRLVLVLALALAVAAALAAPSAAEAVPGKPGYVVVAHPGVAADAIKRADLSSLFLKKVTRWPDGTDVVTVQPREESDARAQFCLDVHKRSLATVKAHWNRKIFSGREVPPVEKPSDDEVVAFVRTHPGAIGYVGPAASTAGVKVLVVND
jgi:ABC-type phosphate transport system substrate-binding protein